MTLPALATTEAFEVRLGRSLDDDEDRVQAALDDASALVRAEAHKTWVTNDELDADIPDVIVTITLLSARRAFDNPSQISSHTVGNFSESYGTAPYLTDNERAAIQTVVSTSNNGLQSVEAQTPWSFLWGDYIAVAGQNEPLPWSAP